MHAREVRSASSKLRFPSLVDGFITETVRIVRYDFTCEKVILLTKYLMVLNVQCQYERTANVLMAKYQPLCLLH